MSLVTLSFIQFNNYFNKILRKPENPFLRSSYSPYPVKSVINNAAFNENDGVTAYHVVPNDIDDVGDYLLVHISNNILSHWFVTEAKRNRLGQCMVTLQRDLLVDYYDTIKSAPAFIERGMLSNDDPMIFNDEGLSFNQIKTDIKPLWDHTECAWIVGYITKDASVPNNQVTADVSISSSSPDYSYNSWNDAPEGLKQLVQGSRYVYKDVSISLSLKNIGYIRDIEDLKCYYIDEIYADSQRLDYKQADDFKLNWANAVNIYDSVLHPLRNVNIQRAGPLYSARAAMLNCAKSMWQAVENNIDDIKESYDLKDDLNSVIEQFNGKIVQVGTTIYSIEKTEDINYSNTDNFENRTSLKNQLVTSMIEYPYIYYYGSNLGTLNPSNVNELYITYKATRYTLKANETGQKATVPFLDGDHRQHTIDAQYDIFAIPFPLNNFGYIGTKKFFGSSFTTQYTIDKEVSLAAANALATALGATAQTSFIHDLQILPYCPIELSYLPISISDPTYLPKLPSESIKCSYIKVNNVIKSFILYCPSSEFTKELDISISKSSNSKRQKTIEKYRLTSGNYSSMFDFTPDMNGGVNKFMVYCNYKPIKPFVKVNPYFNYLYGQESFKDANGLILSGDFSVTMLSDAWTNYLIQNKNFEAMFDRQIQSVELSNDIARQRSILKATGAIGAGAIGGAIGGSKYGTAGAIGGAIVGTASSAIGSAFDITSQQTLREDSLQLQRQMHSYQVDNIQALPDTIQKVTNVTAIDKLIPLLEYYTCSNTEEESFINYVLYNGMTVGRIDTIQNFESNGGFIQGRFIRLEGLSEDYHLANALNTTFQAGFYFEEE